MLLFFPSPYQCLNGWTQPVDYPKTCITNTETSPCKTLPPNFVQKPKQLLKEVGSTCTSPTIVWKCYTAYIPHVVPQVISGSVSIEGSALAVGVSLLNRFGKWKALRLCVIEIDRNLLYSFIVYNTVYTRTTKIYVCNSILHYTSTILQFNYERIYIYI